MIDVRYRLIPVLQLSDESLVKTTRFEQPVYIGDPANTVRIFNELEVDELCLLDIRATIEAREPNLTLLKELTEECFMPLSYGGGITNLRTAECLFRLGFEKIIVNSALEPGKELISEISGVFGSQAVVASIDVKQIAKNDYRVMTRSGRFNTKSDPLTWAKQAADAGAGELLLTSIDREGSWGGMDIPLIRSIADAVPIPLIAHGGAGNIHDVSDAVIKGHASGVALGSMVVFQKKGMGVLVNFPDRKSIDNLINHGAI